MVKAEDQEGKPVWDKPVDVDEKWIQFVDENVAKSALVGNVVTRQLTADIYKVSHQGPKSKKSHLSGQAIGHVQQKSKPDKLTIQRCPSF